MDTNTSPVVDADQIAAQAKHDANAKKYALNIAALIATLLVGYFVHILAGIVLGNILGALLGKDAIGVDRTSKASKEDDPCGFDEDDPCGFDYDYRNPNHP